MVIVRNRTVKSWTIISACFLILWLVGLIWAVGDYYAGRPSEPEISVPEKETAGKSEKELHIVAMGDSLTRGTGDAAGRGYVGYLVDSLKDRSKEDVRLVNLGINGQRSAQLAEQAKKQEIKRQLGQADIVLITIGGNDLFRGGQGLADFDKQKPEELETAYLANVKNTLTEIREANKDATIYFIGLYNPFIEFSEGKEISAIIRHWNYASAELAANYKKVIFVPTFDLFEMNVNDYLYTDKFHPNTKGYKLIADRVASLVAWKGKD
ncbi:SGNH/GDSL hydrolase family protein [Bacillus sp. B-jedd]|uniref:SGNH/GDSL hydrolase family protein n=1 Tax=Bacillus sp. B-jedd TaxID=1476857 RepID=UPI00051572B8|nr:SGNH/GDSL hydrolase family protein [Bacillus sp. B-jedd]CEG26983.1 GDSL-like lipase/acylhydrolase [Bacillus sp. B-jedd]